MKTIMNVGKACISHACKDKSKWIPDAYVYHDIKREYVFFYIRIYVIRRRNIMETMLSNISISLFYNKILKFESTVS